MNTARAGILLVAHAPLASALLSAARHVVGEPPSATTALDVSPESAPETVTARIRQAAAELDQGGGTLVLLDLAGATPANAALALGPAPGIAQVSGASLSMLLRVYNYADAPLAELAEIAVVGGRRCRLEATPLPCDDS